MQNTSRVLNNVLEKLMFTEKKSIVKTLFHNVKTN